MIVTRGLGRGLYRGAIVAAGLAFSFSYDLPQAEPGYVWLVSPEVRRYVVTVEGREIDISRELREYAAKPENRDFMVDRETRGLIVNFENRMYQQLPETRWLNTPYEYRMAAPKYEGLMKIDAEGRTLDLSVEVRRFVPE